MDTMICYCFQYSKEDLKKDLDRHGKSTILERILAESKAGSCRCATTNPKGS